MNLSVGLLYFAKNICLLVNSFILMVLSSWHGCLYYFVLKIEGKKRKKQQQRFEGQEEKPPNLGEVIQDV